MRLPTVAVSDRHFEAPGSGRQHFLADLVRDVLGQRVLGAPARVLFALLVPGLQAFGIAFVIASVKRPG